MRFTSFFCLASIVLSALLAPAQSTASIVLRINAGGPPLGNQGEADSWVSDSGYAEARAPFNFKGEKETEGVENPAPTELYESVRHFDHIYRIKNLPAGRYRVRFHFVDGYASKDRAMDFRINGVLVIDDLSVYEAAGAKNQAMVLEAVAEVREGQPLVIECLQDRGNDVFESGIEVIAVGSDVAVTRRPVNAGADDGSAGYSATEKAAEIRAFTGAPTRLVWIQSQRSEWFTNAQSRGYLVGFDTEDNLGERVIVGDPDSYSKPLFTPDGAQVVFSNRRTLQAHAVNWDGSGLRDLGQGFVSDLWRDPATGVDWVYLRSGAGLETDPIVRRRLSDGGGEEMVWDETMNGHAGYPWFQLSPDGEIFVDAFPWNKCGVGDPATGDWELYNFGCWPGISPDASKRSFIFNGDHVNIEMYDRNKTNHRSILLANIPGVENKRLYHPQWSNHPSFLTVTSPELNHQCEFYLGKFDSGWNAMEAWLKVTENKTAELFGDAWIRPAGGLPTTPLIAQKKPAAQQRENATNPTGASPSGSKRWPQTTDGLLWMWDNGEARNEAPPLPGEEKSYSCGGNFRGTARQGRFFEMALEGGSFEPSGDAGERITTACRATNALTVEALLRAGQVPAKAPGMILGLARDWGEINFGIFQEGDALVLRLRTSSSGAEAIDEGLVLGRIEPGKTHHILLTHKEGATVAYLDGERALHSDRLGGDFSGWEPMPLILGNDPLGDSDWDGTLEAVAVYNRALDEQEAKVQHAAAVARLAERQEIAPLVVDARLVSVTATPDPDAIAPYRRALVENVFVIDQVREGEAAEGGKVVVLQWAIMDGRPLGIVRQRG
ncbi:MAG: LamG-like jellyroll fold domain-containing protein, partial [Verrucomicrobiales bacterium]